MLDCCNERCIHGKRARDVNNCFVRWTYLPGTLCQVFLSTRDHLKVTVLVAVRCRGYIPRHGMGKSSRAPRHATVEYTYSCCPLLAIACQSSQQDLNLILAHS